MEEMLAQKDFIKAFVRLRKDLVASQAMSGRDQARFLLDHYYRVQKTRQALQLQINSLEKRNLPNELVCYMLSMFKAIESQLKIALDEYSRRTPMGRWSRRIVGIGPITATALDVYIDIRKTPYVTNIWSYAGLLADIGRISPSEAQKLVSTHVSGSTATDDEILQIAKETRRNVYRCLENLRKLTRSETPLQPTKTNLVKALSLLPWNKDLKRICYLIGKSFMQKSGDDKCFYGKIYRQMKMETAIKSERGGFADMAKRRVNTVGKDTKAYEAYSQGKLPDAHINSIAMRSTVKIFLEHWFSAAYEEILGQKAPEPYPMAILGHKGKIERESVQARAAQ
jgi:hypothetical protein